MKPVLSVILPAYNEELILDACVRRLHSCMVELELRAEIIVVNDGSSDGTAEIANKVASELVGVFVVHQNNQGIGGAFRAGVARATGDYVLLWPADMLAMVSDLEPYLRWFGRADVVVGVRRQRVGYNPLMRFNAWVYPKLVQVLFRIKFKDINWIHAYRRECFAKIRLTQRGIPMLAEALVRLNEAGASFVEVEVEMRLREGGVASASRLRVMWRTLHGLIAFWRLRRKERRI